MSVTVIAPEDDDHARAVLAHISGARRLDVGVPEPMSWRPGWERIGGVVWLRRSRVYGLPSGLSYVNAGWCRQELGAFYAGMAQASRARWVNPPLAASGNDWGHGKLLQLAAAKELGLRVPRTLATNDPADAKRFLHRVHECLVKSFNPGPYVRVLQKHEDLSGVAAAPVILQDRVRKTADIRVMVAGPHVVATAIKSDLVDFRTKCERLPHEPFTIPEDVAAKLVRLNERVGLRFSVMDLVLRPDGRLVFLEANQQGQWLWLEKLTGQPYAKTLADWLVGGAP